MLPSAFSGYPSDFLEQRNSSAVLKNLKGYLNQLVAKKQINKEILLRLRLDIEQIVLSFSEKWN